MMDYIRRFRVGRRGIDTTFPRPGGTKISFGPVFKGEEGLSNVSAQAVYE